jgi:hypothetical protein
MDLRIEASADAVLNMVMQQGISEINGLKGKSQRDALQSASQNLAILYHGVSKATHERNGKTVTEADVITAIKSLCPLYPFC